MKTSSPIDRISPGEANNNNRPFPSSAASSPSTTTNLIAKVFIIILFAVTLLYMVPPNPSERKSYKSAKDVVFGSVSPWRPPQQGDEKSSSDGNTDVVVQPPVAGGDIGRPTTPVKPPTPSTSHASSSSSILPDSSPSSVDINGRVPFHLTRHHISVCFKHSDHGPYPPLYEDYFDKNESFQERVQCWCLEDDPKKSPKDNLNCVVRLRNATIQRNKGLTIDIIVEGAPADFAAQVANTGNPYSYMGIHLKVTKNYNKRDEKPAPYDQPIRRDDRPLLLVPSIVWANGHYHAIAGPTGTFQIVSTRDVINQYYADNIKKEGVKPTRDVSVKFKYNENSTGIQIAGAGSCSLIDFDSDEDQILIGTDSLSKLKPPSASEIPMTYLSREMLFVDDLGDRNAPRVGTLAWFARRFGYCFAELPEESLTVVDDLWVNLITNQIGTQYNLRRNNSHWLPKEPFMRGVDYLNHMPLNVGEINSARWASGKMATAITKNMPKLAIIPPGSSSSSTADSAVGTSTTPEFVRECVTLRRSKVDKEGTLIPSDSPLLPAAYSPSLKASSTVVGQRPPILDDGDDVCLIVVGRKVQDDPGTFRVRGVPENIEVSIMEALLLPKEATQKSESGVQNRWREMLWSLNERTGLEACKVPTVANPPYDGVSFPPTSEVFPSHNTVVNTSSADGDDDDKKSTAVQNPPSNLLIKRAHLEDLSIPYQYAQIQATNLFIIEEGAPLVWSLVNPAFGSTFIIVYHSHHNRKDHNWGFQPHTDYFVHIPEFTGRCRFILFVIQNGQIPSFAALREAYDRPWKPETMVVMCEDVATKVTTREEVNAILLGK